MPIREPNAEYDKRSALHDAMIDARDELKHATAKYLEASGWVYTSSNNPACQWFWEKTLENGRNVTLDEANAVHMQQVIDSDVMSLSMRRLNISTRSICSK